MTVNGQYCGYKEGNILLGACTVAISDVTDYQVIRGLYCGYKESK